MLIGNAQEKDAAGLGVWGQPRLHILGAVILAGRKKTEKSKSLELIVKELTLGSVRPWPCGMTYVWTHQHACVCLYVCIHTLIHAHTEASIHTGIQYTQFLKVDHRTTQRGMPVAGWSAYPFCVVRMSVGGTQFMMPSRSWDQPFPFINLHGPPLNEKTG